MHRDGATHRGISVRNPGRIWRGSGSGALRTGKE
jgi:hypothetical protein